MFHFEPLKSHHLPLLHKWMQEPHVAEWWGEGKTWSLEELEKKYSSYIRVTKLLKGKGSQFILSLCIFRSARLDTSKCTTLLILNGMNLI